MSNPYSVDSNLKDVSRNSLVTSKLITDFATSKKTNTAFGRYAQCIIDQCNSVGINILWVVAHGALESAWGTSDYAVNRNNLFGINAVDSDPDNANSYPSECACITYYCRWFNDYYLTPGGEWFEGATPKGCNVHYATDPAWATKIVSIMNDFSNYIDSNVSNNGGQVSNPTATTPPVDLEGLKLIGNTSDPGMGTLSEIARALGFGDYAQQSGWEKVLSWNPQLRTGNYDLIYGGLPIYSKSVAPVTDNPEAHIHDHYEVIVKYGDTYSELYEKMYGSFNWTNFLNKTGPEWGVLMMIREHGGDIGNDGSIKAGTTLIFPSQA